MLKNISNVIYDASGNILTLTAANTNRTTGTIVLPTQPVDAAGNVLGRTAANAGRATSTLVDPVQIVDAAGNVLNLTAANTGRTTGTFVLPVQPVDAAGNVIGMQYKTVAAITGVTAVTNTPAVAIAVTTRNCTIQCVSGNLWINPIATAVADATAFRMTAGQALDLYVASNLSVISDASGSTYQVLIWAN